MAGIYYVWLSEWLTHYLKIKLLPQGLAPVLRTLTMSMIFGAFLLVAISRLVRPPSAIGAAPASATAIPFMSQVENAVDLCTNPEHANECPVPR